MQFRVLKPFTAGVSAAVIFTVVFAGLLWLHGNRLVFSSDEGIILDAAARMVHGETPYRDFFGYMTPGSYWLQEAAFRLFGVSLRAGRVVVIFDFSLQCALLFWITARLAGRRAGFAAGFLFFAFQAAKPDFLLAQHRMDSAALSLASIALCLEGRRRKWAWCWPAAGALIVAAAICTPSMALLALATSLWLMVDRSIRRFFLPYAGGMGLTSAAILAVLIANGSLLPLVQQIRWLTQNYANVNIMPYGSIIGGYRVSFGANTVVERTVGCFALFCLALPAVLPLVALAGWGVSLLRQAERRWESDNAIPFLLACMVMYVGSVYPRADVAHLAFIAALPAALTASYIARYAPKWFADGVFGILAVGAGLFLVQTGSGLRNEVTIATPVGTLRASATDAPAVEALFRKARAPDGIYVHPYMPLLYFLTQGKNPTRYSYLAPGMMTGKEEADALASLRQAPPKWLLYLSVSRHEFLRVYPHATNLNHLFPSIEDWRASQYVPIEPAVVVGGYRLYERKDQAGAPLAAVQRDR